MCCLNELSEQVIDISRSFTLAAVDTTTNALSRIFWILSSHPEAQEKLRQELVCAHEEHGELPYEVLVQLPYLDALVRETMRLLVKS